MNIIVNTTAIRIKFLIVDEKQIATIIYKLLKTLNITEQCHKLSEFLNIFKRRIFEVVIGSPETGFVLYFLRNENKCSNSNITPSEKRKIRRKKSREERKKKKDRNISNLRRTTWSNKNQR